MRNGLTLIELIFSMVIISIVFSIVPKIIFASNKSIQTSVKEDAIFNAYTMLGSIVKLDWDENTNVHGEILKTDLNQGTVNDCNETRIGGFIGSRNCKDGNDSASPIAQEDWNDIDDYHSYENNLSKYKLNVNVAYVDSNYNATAGTSELKEINVTVESNSAKTAGFKSSFFYHSANLGLIQIKKEIWQ